MTAAPIVRAPICGGGCGTRLHLTCIDWRGKDRAGAIATALKRTGWNLVTPPRCIPCQRRSHAAHKAKGART